MTTLRKILIWVPIIGVILGVIEPIICVISKRRGEKDPYYFFNNHLLIIALNAAIQGISLLMMEILILSSLYTGQ